MAKAPKKFHTQAGSEVTNLLEKVMSEHHKILRDNNFLILFKHGGWESKGRTILGRAKVVTEDMRSTFGKDAVIYLNREAWVFLTPEQKNYLLDHELCHLDIVQDKNFDTVTAPDGRPKLTTVPHDLEDFVSVIKRHGIIMEDVKRLVRVLGDAKQITLDDVTEEKEKVDSEETSDLEDENQLKLPVGDGDNSELDMEEEVAK